MAARERSTQPIETLATLHATQRKSHWKFPTMPLATRNNWYWKQRMVMVSNPETYNEIGWETKNENTHSRCNECTLRKEKEKGKRLDKPSHKPYPGAVRASTPFSPVPPRTRPRPIWYRAAGRWSWRGTSQKQARCAPFRPCVDTTCRVKPMLGGPVTDMGDRALRMRGLVCTDARHSTPSPVAGAVFACCERNPARSVASSSRCAFLLASSAAAAHLRSRCRRCLLASAVSNPSASFLVLGSGAMVVTVRQRRRSRRRLFFALYFGHAMMPPRPKFWVNLSQAWVTATAPAVLEKRISMTS